MGGYVWKTREGVEMQMHEITDRHLRNIINMLRRSHLDEISSGYSAMSCLQGEAALDAIQCEIDLVDSRYRHLLDKFTDEALSRGLGVL